MGLPTASQVVAKPVGKETREKRMEKCDLKKLEVVVERHKKNRETLMASRVQPKKKGPPFKCPQSSDNPGESSGTEQEKKPWWKCGCCTIA
ncbi:unnamed protein product, partial [Mesorhabditis spiculigera]